MTDIPLPPLEQARTVVDKLYLFVSDQESPSFGCSGRCYANRGIAGIAAYQQSYYEPRPTLRRATAEDLQRLSCSLVPESFNPADSDAFKLLGRLLDAMTPRQRQTTIAFIQERYG